jgi:hypothetical protein
VSFLLEAGGAIYVEQLDDGSVEIRDELPGLKPCVAAVGDETTSRYRPTKHNPTL